PVTMTHASMTPARREKAGINERVIRLSVGLEDVEDLIEDLEQSLRERENKFSGSKAKATLQAEPNEI
ncbi:MAG: PLP-dependent transferase, partial [bacterium]